jgi:hypothetical protein
VTPSPEPYRPSAESLCATHTAVCRGEPTHRDIVSAPPQIEDEPAQGLAGDTLCRAVAGEATAENSKLT